MYLESVGQYDEALKVYNTVLEKNKANQLVTKRIVAISRSLGKTTEAITLLNKHLGTFGFDIDSWFELADIYISLGKLKLARHCLEEIVLINPTNEAVHTKLGE